MGLSLADFGGLRNLEFRKFFIESNYSAKCILHHLEKEEISDKDLLRFYLEYSKLCDNFEMISIDVTRTLFNYKIQKISDERILNFGKIIKEKTGNSLHVKFYRYYSLKGAINNELVFQELVDIFLDEV
jgi:hypothetical protein